jgi:hypothetical protein
MPSHKPSLLYPAQEISTQSITLVQGATQNVSVLMGGSRSPLPKKATSIDCARTTNITISRNKEDTDNRDNKAIVPDRLKAAQKRSNA